MVDSEKVGLPAKFILAPTEPIYAAVRHAGHCKGKDRRLGLFRYSLLPACKNNVAVAGPALGSPAAALLVESLVRSDVGEILLLSACGSLAPTLRVGDLFIPTGGISEEGTSRLYLKGAIPPPDPARINLVEEKSKLIGITPRKGLIWTTDAPNRETPDKVARFMERGSLAVDMEFTALSTLARLYEIKFAALMVVSDEILKEEHRTGFYPKRFRDSLKLGARIAVDTFNKT